MHTNNSPVKSTAGANSPFKCHTEACGVSRGGEENGHLYTENKKHRMYPSSVVSNVKVKTKAIMTSLHKNTKYLKTKQRNGFTVCISHASYLISGHDVITNRVVAKFVFNHLAKRQQQPFDPKRYIYFQDSSLLRLVSQCSSIGHNLSTNKLEK